MKYRYLFVMCVFISFILLVNCESYRQDQKERKSTHAETRIDTINASSRLKSLTILFKDGQSLEVTKPVLKYLSNPGYTPRKYIPTQRIEFTKTTIRMGVENMDTIRYQFSDILSIEYLKNRMNECICLLTLKGGTQTLTSQSPARILERYWTDEIISRKLKLPQRFEDFYPGEYQISGIVNGNEFETNTGQFFDCLAVWDDSANKIFDIFKIIFNYEQ